MDRRFIALGRIRSGMNRTEAAHAGTLEIRRRIGEIQDYKFQPLRLILAPDCTYQPDFMVLLANGQIEFHEVKGGFITDDGMVKARVAAQTFPWFTFRLFQHTKQGWAERELKVF